MKSKYVFWMVGLLTLVSCKELTCDFSYSPTQPAAGEVVTFSNMSTGADDYSWTFGDNSASTSASPTHIYRKPGTYTVTLLIKRNKVEKRSRTQLITILDTIPSLTCDSDTIRTFTPIKFYPKVYNPWKKTLTYTWKVPSQAVVMDGKSLDSAAVVCYFTQPGQADQVELTLQMNDETPVTMNYAFTPLHRNSTSVIYATSTDTLEQFTYIISNQRLFQATLAADLEGKNILKVEQDTVYQYGPNNKYTVVTVQALLKTDIKGFQVDRLMAKIYAYGNEGLWVCNMQGENKRQLITTAVQAIKVDGDNNGIYWASSEGLFFHTLLKTQDNMEPFAPKAVTTVYPNIHRISVNSKLH